MKPYPRIEAYMKFPGDVRKLKSLDIEVTYVQNLGKNKLLFDNLIEKKNDSRKTYAKAFIINGLQTLSRKAPYSLKGIETN